MLNSIKNQPGMRRDHQYNTQEQERNSSHLDEVVIGVAVCDDHWPEQLFDLGLHQRPVALLRCGSEGHVLHVTARHVALETQPLNAAPAPSAPPRATTGRRCAPAHTAATAAAVVAARIAPAVNPRHLIPVRLAPRKLGNRREHRAGGRGLGVLNVAAKVALELRYLPGGEGKRVVAFRRILKADGEWGWGGQ